MHQQRRVNNAIIDGTATSLAATDWLDEQLSAAFSI
jgi:hypothetical protein